MKREYEVIAFDYCLRNRCEIINKVTGAPFHMVKDEEGLFILGDNGKIFQVVIDHDRIFFIDKDNHKGAWL